MKISNPMLQEVKASGSAQEVYEILKGEKGDDNNSDDESGYG